MLGQRAEARQQWLARQVASGGLLAEAARQAQCGGALRLAA